MLSVTSTLFIQEKKNRRAAAIKRAKNGKDKSKAKDGEEVDKDMIRELFLREKPISY